jgi:ATP-dependent Clp protease ATP-binding subunit ClpB
LQAQWKNRKRRRAAQCAQLREQMEQVKWKLSKAERAYDLNKAAELKYGTLTDWNGARKSRITSGQAGRHRLLKEEVDEEDIAEVVSRWTGVPVSKLLEGEMKKLLSLEEELHNA